MFSISCLGASKKFQNQSGNRYKQFGGRFVTGGSWQLLGPEPPGGAPPQPASSILLGFLFDRVVDDDVTATQIDMIVAGGCRGGDAATGLLDGGFGLCISRHLLLPLLSVMWTQLFCPCLIFIGTNNNTLPSISNTRFRFCFGRWDDVAWRDTRVFAIIQRHRLPRLFCAIRIFRLIKSFQKKSSKIFWNSFVECPPCRWMQSYFRCTTLSPFPIGLTSSQKVDATMCEVQWSSTTSDSFL